MPSLLHVLDVDSYAGLPKHDGDKESEDAIGTQLTGGGQNWGIIAVYCCPDSCDKSRAEIVVVQQPADGVPQRVDSGPMVVAVQMDDGDDDEEEE